MHYKLICPNNVSFSFNTNRTNDNINSLYLKFIENELPLYKHDEMLTMMQILENESRTAHKIITEKERKDIEEGQHFWEKVKERVITKHKEAEPNNECNDNIKDLYEMLHILKANNVKELADIESEIYDNIDMYFNDKASNE